jgi:hypothetical protein
MVETTKHAEAPASPSAAQKSAFERLISTAQGVGILIALVVSALNAWFYFADRKQQELKEVFDDQLSITKLYFEKIATLQPVDWCREAPIFANTSAIVARITVKEARDRIQQLKDPLEAPGSSPVAVKDRNSGVQALAIMLIDNFDKRLNSRYCDAAAVVIPVTTGTTGALVHAEAPAGLTASSYGLISASAPPAAEIAGGAAPPGLATATTVTVYIQYPAGTDAQARANALHEKMQNGLILAQIKFVAPPVEAVKQTPGRDQIRIYRDTDEEKARDLQRALNLADAQIVSLARAYKNLPSNTMEIWLRVP